LHLQPIGVLKVGGDDDLMAEDAHPRGAGHQEEQRAQQGNRYQNDQPNLQL